VAVKRCSDGFLNAFEKQWNMKPVVNLVILNKIFTDMALQFSNYITYCTHQEDFQAVLRTARYVLVCLCRFNDSAEYHVTVVNIPVSYSREPAILTEDFCCFPQSFQVNSETLP
jgi:hypothetical protein